MHTLMLHFEAAVTPAGFLCGMLAILVALHLAERALAEHAGRLRAKAEYAESAARHEYERRGVAWLLDELSRPAVRP